MTPTVIEICCEQGHRQAIKVDPDLGEEWARGLAGLMDGTSPMYLYPPGANSPIGKCGICGTPITATVLGYEGKP